MAESVRRAARTGKRDVSLVEGPPRLIADATRDYAAEAVIAGAYATGNLDEGRARSLSREHFSDPNPWAIIQAIRRIRDDADGRASTIDEDAILRRIERDRITTVAVRGGPGADFASYLRATLGAFWSVYDVEDAWKRLLDAKARRACSRLSLALDEASRNLAVDPFQALADNGTRATNAAIGDHARSDFAEWISKYPSVGDLLANLHDFPEPDPLLGNALLTRGRVSMIYGDAGTGKTWFVLAQAACLGAGVDFFGLRVCRPRRVLVISPELRVREEPSLAHRWAVTIATIPGHLQDLANRNVEIITGDCASRLRLVAEGRANTRDVHDLIDVAKDYDVLVVDTLRRTKGDAPEDSSGMALAMDILDDIATRADVAVEIIHHTRKRDGRGPTEPDTGTDDASGGGALKSNSTGIIKLVHDKVRDTPEGKILRFCVGKGNADQMGEWRWLRQFPFGHVYEGGLELLDGPPPKSKPDGRRKGKDARKALILDMGRSFHPTLERPGFGVTEVQAWNLDAGVQASPKTSTRDLDEMAASGELHEVGKDVNAKLYRVVESPKSGRQSGHRDKSLGTIVPTA